MKKLNLKSIIWKEGKHYVAQCLNVEVSSFGSTKRQAQANLAEALELYFADEPAPTISEVSRPQIVTSALRYA